MTSLRNVLLINILLISGSIGLNIPCYIDFDTVCDAVKYAFCDVQARQCQCLPRFKEVNEACTAELGAFCDTPGEQCIGIENSVCTSSYRCACNPGYQEVESVCLYIVSERDLASSIQPNETSAESAENSNTNELELPLLEEDAVGQLHYLSQLAQIKLQQSPNNQRYAQVMEKLLHLYRFQQPQPNIIVKGNMQLNPEMLAQALKVGLAENQQYHATDARTVEMLEHLTQMFGGKHAQPGQTLTQEKTEKSGEENEDASPEGQTGPMDPIMTAPHPHKTHHSGHSSKSHPNYRKYILYSQLIPEAAIPAESMVGDPEMLELLALNHMGFRRKQRINDDPLRDPQLRYRMPNNMHRGGMDYGWIPPSQRQQELQQPAVAESIALPLLYKELMHALGLNIPQPLTAEAQPQPQQPKFPSVYSSVQPPPFPETNLKDLSTAPNWVPPPLMVKTYQSQPGMGQKATDQPVAEDPYTDTVKSRGMPLGLHDEDFGTSQCISRRECLKHDEFSECVHGICVCMDGYVGLLGRCYPALGSHCNERMICGIRDSFCDINGVCSCKDGYMQAERQCAQAKDPLQAAVMSGYENRMEKKRPGADLGKTIESTTLQTWTTQLPTRHDNPWPKSNPNLPFTTEQIRMGNRKNGLGSTSNDFVEEQTLFDTSCLEPEKPCVGIPNSICTLTRHCMCVPGFKKTPFGCRSAGLEESSFPPFIEIRNRTHHARERRPLAIKTQCKQGSVEIKGHCVVGIFLGERCQQDEQCQYYTPDSHCNREICSCSHGFVPSGNATCLPARGLAGECIISEQCLVPKSGCEKGICDCIANYVAKNGLCFAGLNQACSEIFGGAELRCADDQNHVCAAGVCQCRGRVLRGQCIPAL